MLLLVLALVLTLVPVFVQPPLRLVPLMLPAGSDGRQPPPPYDAWPLSKRDRREYDETEATPLDGNATTTPEAMVLTIGNGPGSLHHPPHIRG